MKLLYDIYSTPTIQSLLSINILLSESCEVDCVDFDVIQEDLFIYDLLVVQDKYNSELSQRAKNKFYKRTCIMNNESDDNE